MPNTQKHHRKSIRLNGYDYSQAGAYFVTICTKDRQHFLGKIKDGEMILSQLAEKALEFWEEIPEHFNRVELDFYVIMPNHIHGILVLTDDCSVVQMNDTKETQDDSDRMAVLINSQNDVNKTQISEKDVLSNVPTEDVPDRRAVLLNSQNDVVESQDPEEDVQLNVPTSYYSEISPKKDTLSVIIRTYKGAVTKWSRKNNLIHTIWQPKFYDHIIRNEWDLNRIRKYIYYNPLKWQYDRENQNEIPLQEKKKFWREFLKP